MAKLSKDEKDYPSHEEQIPHLKRLEGQIRGMIEMIEERRYCLELLALSKGVRAGLSTVEDNILMKYLDTCFKDTLYCGDNDKRGKKLEEIRLLLKKSR